MCLITYSIVTYNKLVKLQSRVDNSWAQIDVQLKQRYDLIPNLVETVKGYAHHEESVLTEVTRARASVGSAKTTADAVDANNQLTGALSRLLRISENYPQLQANAGFMNLQGQLKEIEHKIAMARQFYNDTVMNLNQKIKMFPSNIIAKMFKFQEAVFFKAEEAAQVAPQVRF